MLGCPSSQNGETTSGSADLQASSQAKSSAAAALMASQVHTLSTIREHWVPLHEGDNNDSGAQSHSERSGGTPAKAASKVPGGVTEGDNVSTPKPASFWLPHPEAGDLAPVEF